MDGLKSRIRSLLVSDEDLRQWAPVALRDSGTAVDVLVRSDTTDATAIPAELTVASLRPLLFAIAHQPRICGRDLSIFMRERDTELSICAIDCEAHDQLQSSDGLDIHLYRPHTVRWTMPAHRVRMASAYRRLSTFRNRSKKNAHNFEMPADDALRLQAFYVRPRPVVLVSVEYAGGSNLFPMDLIGSLSNEKFTLALRSTSPAVALLRNSRRAVLADVPADRKSTAYDLGAHHKSKSIDWSSLPFSSLLSPNFSLRYPAFTSRVREMEIEEIFAVGSHTLFVCSQVHAEYLADTPQLHHTAGFYQAFRKRRAMAFPEA